MRAKAADVGGGAVDVKSDIDETVGERKRHSKGGGLQAGNLGLNACEEIVGEVGPVIAAWRTESGGARLRL